MIVLERIDQLQLYLMKMLARTEHAVPVRQTCLKLISCIIWAKDVGTSVTIREYGTTDEAPDGRNPANVVWAYIGGQRYAFNYNHDTCRVEARTSSLRGPTEASWADSDDPGVVYSWFLARVRSAPTDFDRPVQP